MSSSLPGSILALATQGKDGGDEERLQELLQGLEVSRFPFDRSAKVSSFVRLFRTLASTRPKLAVMEGTGVAGGLALILARWAFRIRYVVSSGDAVGPYVAARHPMLGVLAALYERFLYRNSAGFIGWTPYLVGRALSLGASRGVTAAGWAPFPSSPDARTLARERVRRNLGIPEQALVVGIVGSLGWSPRRRYCYGQELVQALRITRRNDLRVIIVGDGDGRSRLLDLAGDASGKTVFFVGRVARQAVPEYLAAMDIASLPQSVDKVGSFRYTTKLSEYVAAGLPIVTTQVPLAYDFSGGWIWRLPGNSPWDAAFVKAMARMLDAVTPEEIAVKRDAVPVGTPIFDREIQRERVRAFLSDIGERA
jgi:glycosyltransferase involved in cell wall biosynthesis